MQQLTSDLIDAAKASVLQPSADVRTGATRTGATMRTGATRAGATIRTGATYRTGATRS